MRLYLSSFRLGSHRERLLALLGTSRRTAVICNALDAEPATVRASGVGRELAELRSIGLECQELDLRHRKAAQQMQGFDLVWARGGNTFVLRRVLADSGADAVLVDLLHRDRVAYGGYSAGACVLAPDLTGLERVDDLSVVERPLLRGLAILDCSFVPHVQSPDHPESAGCDAIAAEYSASGRPHWALRDGEVLLIENDLTRVLH